MTSKRPDTLPGKTAAPQDARAARVVALDALARRDHASQDLRRKLLDKGYDATVVEAVVGRLCAEKLVDDGRFIDNFVNNHAQRGHGPVRVRADLRKLGLEGERVEDALAAHGDWLGVLRKVREKKFGAPLPTHYADKQRQARFLAFRGFTGSQIRLGLGFDTDFDAER